VKFPAFAAGVLALATSLAGCTRSLDTFDVRQFIDLADDAARKRYAPEICELRGKSFVLTLRYQAVDSAGPPTESKIGRKLYCREAGKFSRLYQYRLERKSLDITLAPDRKTARAIAVYEETLPHYPADSMPATLDNFEHFVVIESRDESIVGIEDGDIRFLESKVDAIERELLPKADVDIPYE
jgi:hypothetical protein